MITGIVLLCVMAAVVIPLLVWYFVKYVWIWKPLHTPGFTVKVAKPADVTEVQVQRAVELAVEQLSTVWKPFDVRYHMEGVSILVASVEKWQSAGQTVGGEQDGSMLKVNKSMDSLFHECAHWLELELDGARDDAHANWAAKGIFAADDRYRAALGAQS